MSAALEPLAAYAYAAALVFCRMGAVAMTLPGLGEASVPPRVRLAFALLLAIGLAPIVGPSAPVPPPQPMALAGVLGGEILIGLGLGVALRLTVSALAVAGQIAAAQTGLAMATSFDPSQGQQGALFGTFLGVTGVALLFALDLHHLFLRGAAGSYGALPAGELAAAGDFAALGLAAAADAFAIAVQMTAPLIVFGLVVNLGLGVLGRMMPQAQIFFIAMPIGILAGLAILAATLGGALLVWADSVERLAREFG